MSHYGRCFCVLLMLCCAVLLAGCAGVPPRITIPAEQPKPTWVNKKRNVVVVLGAGGARGYAHLGVLRALKEAHIPIDGLVCASVGCVVGALYADTGSAKATFDSMMAAGFWDFADISNMPNLRGPTKGYRLEKFLLAHMQARNFNELKIPLLVATTDLATGNSYLIQGGPVAPAVLASAALPGIVQPVELYGRQLIDGGVAAPVPVKFADLLHPRAVIAINIAQLLDEEIPYSAYEIYKRAYQIMWLQLTDLGEDGADVIVRPSVGDVGTFDMGQRYEMYLRGLEAGRKMIPKIRVALEQKGIMIDD